MFDQIERSVLCNQLETGKEHLIYVLPDFSVRQIRQQLALKTKTHPKQLMLVLEGAQISDYQKLSELSLNGKKINFFILEKQSFKHFDNKNNIQLCVKTLKGQIFPVLVNLANTVRQVKKIIQSLYKFQFERQKLLFLGKVLGDDEIISELGVEKDSFFVLMLTAPLNKKLSQSQRQIIAIQHMYKRDPIVKNERAPIAEFQRERENSIKNIMSMGFQRKDIQRVMAMQNDAHKVVQILINGGQKQQVELQNNSQKVKYKKMKVGPDPFKYSKEQKKQQIDPAHQAVNSRRFSKNEKKEQKQKKVDDYNENECKLCMSNHSDMVCIPCFHMCVCQKCSYGLEGMCPICRKIGQFKKIFKS